MSKIAHSEPAVVRRSPMTGCGVRHEKAVLPVGASPTRRPLKPGSNRSGLLQCMSRSWYFCDMAGPRVKVRFRRMSRRAAGLTSGTLSADNVETDRRRRYQDQASYFRQAQSGFSKHNDDGMGQVSAGRGQTASLHNFGHHLRTTRSLRRTGLGAARPIAHPVITVGNGSTEPYSLFLPKWQSKELIRTRVQ